MITKEVFDASISVVEDSRVAVTAVDDLDAGWSRVNKRELLEREEES